jgi:hypothetical protein
LVKKYNGDIVWKNGIPIIPLFYTKNIHTMANDCSNYIKVSGSVENMKPIYDFFNEGQEKIDSYYKNKKEFIKNNPEFKMWDKIEGFELDDILVMNTLVPHDEEYDKIEKSGEFLLNPQTVFYGCKWDFDLKETNVISCEKELITLSSDTPWSPPTEFCRRLSEKYGVFVHIFYSEGGNNFSGVDEYDDGEHVRSEEYEYVEGLYYLDNECFWSEVDYNLDNLEDITEDEFLSRYSFVSEEDRETIRKDFQLSKVD